MADWRSLLNRLGYQAETRFDELRHRLDRRLGLQRRPQILAYRGFGRADRLCFRGRVVEQRAPLDAESDSLWHNLLAAYQRVDSDELPGVSVTARFAETSAECVTDEEGYFEFELRPEQPGAVDAGGWNPIALSVPSGDPSGDMDAGATEVEALAEVLVPSSRCRYGVVSDIDDTILVTHATDLLKMARLTFLENARTRMPFDGVAAFYRALQQGVGDDARRPLFYVSSSPWNLYELLVDFMQLNQIPAGPLLLRDFGLEADRFFKSSHEAHKRAQIETLLNAYPELSFVLIGDSGQHDAEIYAGIATAYPGRIAAVYIRDVEVVDNRPAVGQAIARTREHGVAALLVEDTLKAAEHAAEHGLIERSALASIAEDARKDRGEPGETERLLGQSGPST